MAGANGDGAGGRGVVYCLLPGDLASKLHVVLRRQFRDDPSVEVVVEQRANDRRSGGDRRAARATPPQLATERRRIRAVAGRRVDERRAVVLHVDAPTLPRRARPHAARLVFVERFEPSALRAEDIDTARLVLRIQAGDPDGFSVLYARYFDRVYGYLSGILRDAHEAEDATQNVFMKVHGALPRFEYRGVPFRVWLFLAVRRHALSEIQKLGRMEVLERSEIDRQRETPVERVEGTVLEWISDRELLVFVERLPLSQRQVLLLRYVVGLSNTQIAAVLGRTPNDVAALHTRAIGLLRRRLTAVGRGAARERRSRMRRWNPQAPVLRQRRFALLR
jgi:RNA polymerase sigma-70 factor (ECF subfamily)